jgi:hypothetical protein
MTTEIDIIQEAIERVERERSLLSIEQRRLQEFREAVSRTTVATSNTSANSSVDLVEMYRETVMDTPDFEKAYNETLKESLEHEFSPSSAEAILSDSQLSQKNKRDLLVEINTAIDRRENLSSILEQEKESLERIHIELTDIRESMRALPSCSFQEHSFEELLDLCGAYDDLEQRCERLLKNRQQHLHSTSTHIESVNQYLYNDLDSSFPGLSAIATTVDAINSSRKDTSPEIPALSA